MKNINLKIAALSALFVVTASVGQAGIGPAGCGLGNQVFGGKDSQVLASTTNGSFYSQLFGITFGTSNCIDSASSAAKLEMFVDANQTKLAADMARGNGETLASVGHILGCSDSGAVSESLHKSFGEIFSNNNANEVSSKIRDVLKKSKNSCNELS
jgi:Protein of unknown function (DUF3015)